MLTIASKKVADQKLVSAEEYMAQRFVYDDLIQRGEPYVYGARIPLIIDLGPKTYWRLHSAEFDVYGEGLDPEEVDEIDDVLTWRRQGNVYGHWHSKYCIEGESGYFFHSNLISVSFLEFQQFVQRLIKEHDSSGL